MNRRFLQRLDRVHERLGSPTVVRELARPAYEVFRKTGVLPDDQEVAHEVVQRVLRGYDAFPNTGHPVLDRQRAVRAAVETPDRPPDPILDSLLDEAVWAPDPMRWAARDALRGLAGIGLDVTKPLFAGRDVEEHIRGSVGLTLLGFPDVLYTPPYEERAERLLANFARVRERVGDDDDEWFGAMRAAEIAFAERGEMPPDELQQEAMLALHELDALMRHGVGEDVAGVLALIDGLRNTPGWDRDGLQPASTTN